MATDLLYTKHQPIMSTTTTYPAIPNPYEAMLSTMLGEFRKLEAKINSMEANLNQIASQTSKEPQSETLSVTETAKILSIHRETVLSLLQKGELKAAKSTGKKYLITRLSINEYINQSFTESRPSYKGH